MTRRISNISHNLVHTINSVPEEKLGFWLVGLIFISLVVYISSLNFAVSEAFERQKIEREAKVMRQDMQAREEFFIATLSQFYDEHASSFSKAETSKELFVLRDNNVAQANSPILR